MFVYAVSQALRSFFEPQASQSKMTNRAVAVLRGDAGVGGVVWFHQKSESDPIVIKGEITGLAPGQHGFHVHQWGDSTQGCTSAGPHFNPFGKTHGGPKDDTRHAGDLGNVEADGSGVAKFEITDSIVKIHGVNSVIGRSLVIHAGTDDLGKGVGEKAEESAKTGNAGARAACGVIALAAPEQMLGRTSTSPIDMAGPSGTHSHHGTPSSVQSPPDQIPIAIGTSTSPSRASIVSARSVLGTSSGAGGGLMSFIFGSGSKTQPEPRPPPQLVTTDGSISSVAWTSMARDSPKKSRIRMLIDLQESPRLGRRNSSQATPPRKPRPSLTLATFDGRTVMKNKNLQVSTLEGIYHETKDMLDDLDTRDLTLKSYIELTQTQYSQVGLALRHTFFEQIRKIGCSELTLKWLNVLSQEGKLLHGFEKDMDFLLSDWVKATLWPVFHAQSKGVLELAQRVILYNSSFIAKESMRVMVRMVCLHACRAGDPLSRPCIQLVGSVLKYSELPESELLPVITTLCQLIADCERPDASKVREDSWKVMKTLLLSKSGHNTRKHLQLILDRNLTFNANQCNIKKVHRILRGAVFCLANANWGTQQIDSIKCPPSTIIPSMQRAMFADPSVCRDVLVALRRLLFKYGRELQLTTWYSIFHLFKDVVRLCDRRPNYIECNSALQHLLDIIEELYKDGHLGCPATLLFDLIEKSSEKRPDSSVIALIVYKAHCLTPYVHEWISKMHDLVIKYLGEESTVRRSQALSVLHAFFIQYRGMFETDIVTNLMLPVLDLTKRETNNKVQYQMLNILFDVAKSVSIRTGGDIFEKTIALIRKLFNENILRVDEDTSSTISDRRESRGRGSTSTRDNTPSDVISSVCNDNLEIIAQGLGEILSERWKQLTTSQIVLILNILIEHVTRQYQSSLIGEEGGDIRVRVFASILSIQACPTTHRIRRHALGEDDSVLNHFLFCKGAPRPAIPQSGELSWDDICVVTTQALQKDTWWANIRVVLQCLYKVFECPFLVRSATTEHVSELMDSVIKLHAKVVSGQIQVSDSEVCKYLPPVLTILLNYGISTDNQKEVCRILVECVKTESTEAVMACDLAIQMVPSVMSGFALHLISTLSIVPSSALRAIPTLELLSDASGVQEFYKFFQPNHFHLVADILCAYINARRFNTFVIASVHRILMRWYAKVPTNMVHGVSRYYETKFREAVSNSCQNGMSRQPSGDGRHMAGVAFVNGMPDTPPPMGLSGTHRPVDDGQDKMMDELFTAFSTFLRLGKIDSKVNGMKEPEGYGPLEENHFAIQDSIISVRTIVDKSKIKVEEDDVFETSTSSASSSSSHLMDQRRRYQSAIQPSHKTLNKPRSHPKALDDLAIGGPSRERAKSVVKVPVVSYTQMTIRHMYGKTTWLMRTMDELPEDYHRKKLLPTSHSSMLIHLTSLPGTIRIGKKQGSEEMISTRLRNIDRLPGIELHAVGVLFMGPDQKKEEQILGNYFGNKRYDHFVRQLGQPITNDDEPAGLQVDKHGEYTYAFTDETSQIIFLIANLMPRMENDPKCNMKKRLIANNFVCIVWNESGYPYTLGLIAGDFNHVTIEVQPVDADNVLILIHAKAEIACWLAMRRVLIHEKAAANLIRKLCIRSKLAVEVWRSYPDSPGAEPYLSSAVTRLRKIQQVKGL